VRECQFAVLDWLQMKNLAVSSRGTLRVTPAQMRDVL
jgi:hypothetical protein